MTAKPTLEQLRAAAYKAYADHVHDMKNDPAYRREFERQQRRQEKAQGEKK